MSEKEKLEKRVVDKLCEWKKEYYIPLADEFDVIELIKLEFEYEDLTDKSKDHVKTRRELLDMRDKLKSRLRLNTEPPKIKNMYVEIIPSPADTLDKMIIYIGGKLINTTARKNIQETALHVRRISASEGVDNIYIKDMYGCGKSLADELMKIEICANPLKEVAYK